MQVQDFQQIMRECRDESRVGEHHPAATALRLPLLSGWARAIQPEKSTIVDWVGRSDGDEYGYSANALIQSVPLEVDIDPVAVLDAAISELTGLPGWRAIDAVQRGKGDSDFVSLSGVFDVGEGAVRVMAVYAVYQTSTTDFVSLTASASVAQFDSLRADFSELLMDSAGAWIAGLQESRR